MTKNTSVINLAPKRETLNASQIEELIDLWLIHIKQNCSERTHYDYKNTIQYFLGWWSGYGQANDYMLSKAALADFNSHLDELQRKRGSGPLAWHTRNDALRRVGQVFRWAAEEDYIDRDHSIWIPAPTGRRPEREPIPRGILPKLLAATEEADSPARARCIIALLGGTGMRRGEAAKLNIEDICHDGKSIEYILIRARLKNSRTRAVGVAPGAMAHIIDFIGQRRHGALFLGEHGKGRATAKTIYRDCIEVQQIAGVKLNRPCHDLRVAFASEWARTRRGQTDGNILAKQLGHKHFNTTRRWYIETDIQDIQEVMINPFANQEVK